MSSSRCLRRLTVSTNALSKPSTPLCRNGPILRYSRNSLPLSNGAKALYSTYLRSPAPVTLSLQNPRYITQIRQFSLSKRYNEEQIVKTPEMAESITEGTLKGWSKSVGDYVEQDEEIGSIETDKIDVAINSPAAGTIKKFLVEAEDTIEVGQDIVVLELGGEPGQNKEQSEGTPKEDSTKEDKKPSERKESQKDEQPKESSSSSSSAGSTGGSPRDESTPEKPPPETQLDKSSERPKEKEQKEQKSGQPSSQQQPQKQSKPQPKESEATQQPQSPYGSREERRVKMNRMRLRIAERLKQSQNTAASLTTFNEVDMSNLMDMRKQYKDEILNKTGVKFGFMGAFAMASVLAMKAVPTANASIEGPGGGDTIVYRDYVDISVAVATEKGLVTPVVRNAETLDIVGIEKAISDLGKKARDNKLTIEDMAGGTFTISNGGVFGSLMGTPIINLPQTAVLGLHAIKDKPVAINGKVEIRPMMYLALTYDHRLLDGREAVTFLVKIKEYIEDPRKMLLALP